jgi:acetoin utilization deacetylase AcuC-like enzyme
VGLALSDRAIVVHPVSGAHHARVASGSGFCTFNYLARRPTVRSTLILDLDAHYGDGTDLMTAGLPEFSHFDIHGSSRTETDLTPRGQWHGVRNATEYFAALTSLPTALDRAPDLIHWQAGMDPYELDDVGGITGMSARRLYKRDLFVAREIVRRRISTVVTLAGGYVKGVERLHLQTFRALRQALQEVTL